MSDEPGVTIANGFPIFPETYESFPRNDGEEPQKRWYGICAVAITPNLAVLEAFGSLATPEEPPEDDPQQPYHPQDAPLMRSI